MSTLARILRAATLAVPVLVLAVAPEAFSTSAVAGIKATLPDPTVEREFDEIIPRDTRRVVQGRILEMTDTEIKMEVVVAGIKATRTFKRSNIVSIVFGDAIKHGEDAMADSKMAKGGRSKSKSKDGKDMEETEKEIFDDTAKVYVVNLEGSFGRHISQTPLLEVFEDVDAMFDDLVWDDATNDYVVDPKVRRQHIVILAIDNHVDGDVHPDGVFRAEDMYPIIERNQQKGRRVVFWIHYATGGAVFLAFSTPEMYFTKDASMSFGRGNDLEDFSFGTEMVQEKQISLRLGHAVGAARVGRYDDAHLLIPAMARSRNWLSVRYEGGKPILSSDEPLEDSYADESKVMWSDGQYTWQVLTDNGMGEFEDDEERLEANDMLFLDSDLAYRLQISKGTADTLDDLLYELDVDDNHVLWEENEGQEAVDKWADGIERTLDLIGRERSRFGRVRGRIHRELADIQIQGDWKERNAARGKTINLYKQIMSQITRYEEAFDAKGAQRSEIRKIIDEVKLAQDRDPKPKAPSRRRR